MSHRGSRGLAILRRVDWNAAKVNPRVEVVPCSLLISVLEIDGDFSVVDRDVKRVGGRDGVVTTSEEASCRLASIVYMEWGMDDCRLKPQRRGSHIT
jgi:hypothetical protein